MIVCRLMTPLGISGAVNRISIELEERLVRRGASTPSGAAVHSEVHHNKVSKITRGKRRERGTRGE